MARGIATDRRGLRLEGLAWDVVASVVGAHGKSPKEKGGRGNDAERATVLLPTGRRKGVTNVPRSGSPAFAVEAACATCELL